MAALRGRQAHAAALQEQIAVYDKIGQFKAGAPKLEDCYTSKILEMTASDRPKIA